MRRGTMAGVVAITLGSAGIAGAAPGLAPVLGGDDVPIGEWRDCAAVLFGGLQECSGVLIAPTVALTAGHCFDPTLDSILVGTNDLSQPGRGERIDVVEQLEYPDSQNAFDITALVLASPSTVPPRAIATGWARLDIVDGARVQLVGYGAIDRDANVYIDEMQEVETTITDADCSDAGVGCNVAARPAGELGAGGMGKDTCPGDSGGPLYLRTSYGDFLAGITSRGYLNSPGPPPYCEDGGIYERPDAIVDWIEAMTGVAVTHGPEPTASPIEVVAGDGGETAIDVNDPVGDDHAFSIPEQPLYGRAAVNGDGRVRYCANADHLGADTVLVEIADKDAAERRLVLSIAVDVVAGTAPAEACSLEFEGGGCCSAGTRLDLGAAAPFVVVGVVLLRRRRRR